MYILGIETSCDETALALLNAPSGQNPLIVAEEVSSQVALHELYGGVVPELASREHLKNLPLLFEKVLSDGAIEISQLTAIGVTRGPGLKGCLLMGYHFAKGLSQSRDITLLGINHIEGHLLAPMLDNPELKFPYLCLIVSGGHTEIHEVRGVGHYRLITRTHDDAAGEAFDKSANLLGLTYPGGAKLAELADTVSSSAYKLPKVMRNQEGFSFSGLKTAISLLIKKESDMLSRESVRAEIAHAVQKSIIETLLHKLKGALAETQLKQVAVSGGVAANIELRRSIAKIKGVQAYFPTQRHSTDNGAMIAYVAYHRYLRGDSSSLADGVLPSWPVETVN